jgi:pentose-5-phosphate-3-epimerase
MIIIEHIEEQFEKQFEDFLSQVKTKISQVNISVTPHTIMTIVRYIMEVVESSKLPGDEKKIAVNRLLRQIIKESNMHYEDKKICENLIDNGVVGDTIELIISASKGEININVKQAISIGGQCCLAIMSLLTLKKRM